MGKCHQVEEEALLQAEEAQVVQVVHLQEWEAHQAEAVHHQVTQDKEARQDHADHHQAIQVAQEEEDPRVDLQEATLATYLDSLKATHSETELSYDVIIISSLKG